MSAGPCDAFEKEPSGTYVLLMRVLKRKEIAVGRLGVFPFHSGYYLYVGSAFGPGGLNARIARHLRRDKKHHWHIDCLTSKETIVDIWFSKQGDKHECEWATIFKKTPGLYLPVPGFGSSDCSCPSHLFFSKKKPLFARYRNLLGHGLERIM